MKSIITLNTLILLFGRLQPQTAAPVAEVPLAEVITGRWNGGWKAEGSTIVTRENKEDLAQKAVESENSNGLF